MRKEYIPDVGGHLGKDVVLGRGQSFLAYTILIHVVLAILR